MDYIKFMVILVLTLEVHGHSTYVPHEACVNMFPEGHTDNGQKVYSQTTPPPYEIILNTTYYSANSAIEVFVSSTGAYSIDFFEGILLQVRRANCEHTKKDIPVGTFMLEQGEDFLNLMTCTNAQDTIAHKAHDHIYNRTFTWKAPPNTDGPLFVRATIARRQRTFWTNVVSEFILDPSSSVKPETCTDMAAMSRISTILLITVICFINFIL